MNGVMRNKGPKVLRTEEEEDEDWADRVARAHPDWDRYRPGEPHRVVKWYHWILGLKD